VVPAFLAELQARGREPLLARTSGTIRFDVGHGKGWLVSIAEGEVSFSRANSRSDAIVRLSEGMLEDLVTGRANATAAMLRGRVSVEGDLALVQTFQRLFPGPPPEVVHDRVVKS
jgi:putative sterol carrier protein